MWQCDNVTMYPCDNVLMYQCDNVSMWQSNNVTMYQGGNIEGQLSWVQSVFSWEDVDCDALSV